MQNSCSLKTRSALWKWPALLPVVGQFQLLGLLFVGVDQELPQQFTLLAEVQVPDFLLLSTVGVDHFWPLLCVLRHNLFDLCRKEGMEPPGILRFQVWTASTIGFMHFRSLPPIYLVNRWTPMTCKKIGTSQWELGCNCLFLNINHFGSNYVTMTHYFTA